MAKARIRPGRSLPGWKSLLANPRGESTFLPERGKASPALGAALIITGHVPQVKAPAQIPADFSSAPQPRDHFPWSPFRVSAPHPSTNSASRGLHPQRQGAASLGRGGPRRGGGQTLPRRGGQAARGERRGPQRHEGCARRPALPNQGWLQRLRNVSRPPSGRGPDFRQLQAGTTARARRGSRGPRPAA